MSKTRSAYITAYYLSSDETEQFLQFEKETLRRIVAEVLDYTVQEVAFIARRVEDGDVGGLFDPEFVIEAGLDLAGKIEGCSQEIVDELAARFPFLREVDFGVCIRLAESDFAQYVVKEDTANQS